MPGYLVKHERIAVGGTADLTIRSLLDRQQFSDPLDAALRLGISSAAWPLFGLLWPSGRQLAAHMAVRPMRAGERILEIGCGLALASLVSHRRGADVTASDCHPLAAGFLAENLRLNGLPPMTYRHGHWTASGLAAVAWAPGDPLAVHGRFDLIIGSDLLYERDESASLARFIARHAAPGAQVLIVDPDRGNRAAFSRQMGALGFGVTQLRLDRAEADGQPAYKGRLLSYRQPADAR
ncbi:MAG TPA: methyltransferase domain-containing protein [Albitalea sp.]